MKRKQHIKIAFIVSLISFTMCTKNQVPICEIKEPTADTTYLEQGEECDLCVNQDKSIFVLDSTASTGSDLNEFDEYAFYYYSIYENYGYEAYIDSLSSGNSNYFAEKHDSISKVSSFDFKENKNQDFKIYPNPTNDFVIVKFKEEISGIYKFYLHDMYGKAIICDEISQAFSLDLEGYRKGIYTITVSGNNFVKTKRIILK